ncbi:MAG: phasin family protein [Betaproteobacteria bacterium]|nr:phasin family protein [Betaproteobacteria bacterium]
MVTKPEQFSELHRKNMEAALKLAQMSIENSQRIMALQVDVAKKLFQDSVASAKALTSAKDPQQAIALRTQYAQDTAQQMMETARQIAEIGNASRTEFSHMLTEQLASGSKDLMATFQSFFGSLPGSNSNVLETMQQAMATANEAFEQIAKASSAAFSSAAAAPAKKKK